MKHLFIYRSILIICLAGIGLAMIFHHTNAFSKVSATALTQESDPISGEWNASFTIQGTTVPATFELKLDGDKVTGKANSEHTGPGTLSNGSWVNDKLSFTMDFAAHESIIVTGNLKDDKLVGEFKTEGMQGTWEAKKK